MLMFSYGANLNIESMKKRCPTAHKLGPFFLKNSQLVFRSLANVEPHRGTFCPGSIWDITVEDEKSLDEFEGVNVDLYIKTYYTLKSKRTNKSIKCLVYRMRYPLSFCIAPPHKDYLKVIKQGYKDFNLPIADLNKALLQSYRDEGKV